ncbi:MAG: Holliday junction branch migration protein RuvA [Clostridiales bacterium]|nr:Holliday junction branch migration protein RuvA [Clostridiales bacterium]
MLHYIKGKLMMRIDGGVVVETGGIGFEINVPENSAVYLAQEGDNVSLFLNMIVREDDMSLYGFSEKEGLELFKKLITVNGVGAKAAMAILSVAPVSELRKAIVFEDADFLTRANGVGKKTAQRIVLELKDKIGDAGISSDMPVISDISSVSGDARGEAVSALIALGYSRAEAAGAVSAVAEQDLSSEDYIKRALKKLF